MQPGQLGSQVRGEDQLPRAVADLERAFRQFSAANVLATAGIGVVPNGILVNGQMLFNRMDGTLGVSVDPASGTFTAWDATGATAVARFGQLLASNPGHYGMEVLINGGWVQVGAGNVDWGTGIANKPATFPPSAHTHAGTDVTSPVADAAGSTQAYNNNVGGTSYYAVWVGNDTKFGKNTSSIRYKTNVREHYTDPANVLALTPVLYDRKTSGVTEYGLIAEQVAEHFPELVQWFDGQIDNVRYDLLSVALLSVVKHQDARLAALEAQMAKLVPTYTVPAPSPVGANSAACNNPPATIPAPSPYTIQPQ